MNYVREREIITNKRCLNHSTYLVNAGPTYRGKDLWLTQQEAP